MAGMLRERPLFFVVATVAAVFVGLAGGWFTKLPRHVLASLQNQMSTKVGLALEARNPRFGYDGGFVLRLDTVSLTPANAQTSLVDAQGLSFPLGFSALFGSAGGESVVLQSAAINLDVAAGAANVRLPMKMLELRESIVRLRDRKLNAVITLADVTGTLRRDSEAGASVSVSFVLNDVLTRLSGEITDANRLTTDGSPADLTLATGDKLVSFSGRMRIADGMELDGQVTAEGADLGRTLHWLGLPLGSLASAGPMRLSAGFSSTGLKADLTALAGQANGVDFGGKMTVTASSDLPRLDAELEVPRLDVWNSAAAAENRLRPWSEGNLAVTDLRAFTGQVLVKTEHLRFSGVNFGAHDISLVLENGKAKVTTKGDLNANVTLSAEKTRLGLAAQLSSAKGADVLRALLGVPTLSGPASLAAEITGEGSSVAGLVSTLRGKVEITGENIDIPRINVSSLLQNTGDGWRAVDGVISSLSNLNLEAKLEEGVATITKAALATKDITLRPEGELDLLRQAFDLRLNPKGPVVERRMRLKGTWAKPIFVVDAGKPPELRPTAATKSAKPPPAD